MSKKAVFLDIDGTTKRRNLTELLLLSLIRGGMLPEERWKQVLDMREQYKRREIPWSTYDAALISAFEQDLCMQGLSVHDVSRIAQKAVEAKGGRINIFARELIEAAKECEYVTVFVSGSPLVMVKPFAEHHGCQICHGAIFETEQDVYTGISHNWRESKDVIVRRLAEQYDIDLGRSVAVGDAIRDFPMFEITEFPILFNPTKELLQLNRESNWPLPIVVEQRAIYAFALKTVTTYESVELKDILPADLGESLQMRLMKHDHLA